ncbi:MAG TPA: hypothetical protein VF395_23045 [Polyangiaceae bacterium]
MRAVLGVAGMLHLSLLAYFIPLELPFSGVPFHTFDYALHAYQVDRALTAFRESGRLWAYDPFQLAGQPANAVEDLTSKSLELFVIAFAKLGANPWALFNGYVLLVHLMMPFVAWKAARLFDLSRLAAALAVLFWVVLWYFDSLLHWFWYVGMISWGAASTLTVLVVALMYRALEGRKPATYAGLVVTAALVTLVHPFAVLTLVVPLAALYARSFRTLRPWEHGALAAGAFAAFATTLVWLGTALRFRHYIGPVDAFLWPTLSYVWFDWLDLLKDVLMTGQPVRTAFRTLAFGLAFFGLLRLRRAQDRRTLPLVLVSFGSLALAYLSGYSSALRQTQPYRHLGPGVLGAALVAAVVTADVLGARTAKAGGRSERAALALGLALAVPVLLRTVAGFLPTLLPGGAAPRKILRASLSPSPPGAPHLELPPTVLGYDGPDADYPVIGDYLTRTVGQTGRVAVFDWVLGEYLATFTRVPVLGGIPQRNVPHAAAHPLRLDLRPEHDGDDPIRRYLEQYAVRAVVLHGPDTPWDTRRDLFAASEGVGDYRIYLVRHPSGYFERGGGRVTEQHLDSIRVSDATGPEVVLRFHWLETLRCRPDCTVERAEAHGDGGGFLRVRTPPSTFEIFSAAK